MELADIEALDDNKVLEIIDFAADLLHYRKRPQDTRAHLKRSLLSEIRECHRKVWHSTRRAAERSATKWSKKYGVPFRVYECTNCGGFHTTTQAERVRSGTNHRANTVLVERKPKATPTRDKGDTA